MSVPVDPVPPLPRASGDLRADYDALRLYLRDLSRIVTQMRERTGGDDDLVAPSAAAAFEGQAQAASATAGISTPTPGGSVTITPSSVLSYTALSRTSARISVAAHTRSNAASPLSAGTVADAVARGATYYVYYLDPSNLGGTVTYLATTDQAGITSSYRLIGPLYVPAAAFRTRTFGNPLA